MKTHPRIVVRVALALAALALSLSVTQPAKATSFTTTGALNGGRAGHSVTLLPSGQVLVAAGFYVNGPAWLSNAELYNSATGRISLVNPVKLPGGAFQFAFTGASNGTNTILATTNPTLPLTSWTVLGVAPEFSTGLFVFSDPQAANGPQRF